MAGRRRAVLLRAALSSCGIVEAHLSAAGSASAPKSYQAPPAAAEQPLPQPLAITPRSAVQFSCPKCSAELLPSAEQRVLRCAGGHAFDVAKEGYVHLAKRTRASAEQQAESDEVTRASRAFFEAGGFGAQLAGVATEVSRALADCPDAGGERHVLNAGCGEGAYLRLLQREQAQLWGTDVSKLAVRYAAKRQPAARFAVGSPHLPAGRERCLGESTALVCLGGTTAQCPVVVPWPPACSPGAWLRCALGTSRSGSNGRLQEGREPGPFGGIQRPGTACPLPMAHSTSSSAASHPRLGRSSAACCALVALSLSCAPARHICVSCVRA